MKIHFSSTAVALSLVSSSALAASSPIPEKPNFVVLFLDDSGYGDYAHNGNPVIRTPNITKLTQDGVNFTQFYVTTAACSASRYSLLTGRYPCRSGLNAWVIGPGTKRYLHPREVTIADGLKTRGYATAMFGKWHLGTPNGANGHTPQALPLAHGFDKWLGTNVSHDYGNAMLIKCDPQGSEPAKGYSVVAKNLPSQKKVCESLTGMYTEEAVKFIDANKDKPFFLYVAYNMPHLAIFASDKFKGRSKRGLLGDVMEELDDSVGQIRAALEKNGISKNTMIVFASDNGPWIRFRKTKWHPKYGEARLNVGYAMPFRDGKGSTWEGGHRVPGIICWPGVIEGGRTDQTPVSTLDILPTIFSLAGVKLPSDRSIDGRDISPHLLKGKALDPFKFFYCYSDTMPSAIREGPWKLHVRIGSQTGNNYGFKASRKTPLLFQVEHDISERIDRATEKPEITKKLLADLEAFEAQVKAERSFWDKK